MTDKSIAQDAQTEGADDGETEVADAAAASADTEAAETEVADTEAVDPEDADAEPETPPVPPRAEMDMPEDRILDPAQLTITRGPDGHARLEIADERCVLLLRAVRLFPISHRRGFIALSDANADEIGIIRDLRALPRLMRRIILEELRKRYFVPQITLVHSLKDEYGVLYWDVETSRGRRQFVVRDVHDNIREFPGGRMQISDVDGNEFEIANIDSLPGKGVTDLYRLL